MVPGPNQIVACPSCGALAKYGTLASGNTFGARIWTDGRRHYPMLPRAPAVVKCRHCNIVHWLSEARKVGRVELWGKELQAVPSAWRSAENVQEPDEFQYYEALRAGLARTREQERNLRIFAWWRANDAYREIGHVSFETEPKGSPAREENLQALLLLLNESDEGDILMKVEVYRELQAWPQAEALLNRVWTADYSTVSAQIRELCQLHDWMVREVNFGRPIRPHEPVRPDPIGPEPWLLKLEHPLQCPHCHTSSDQYRQVRGGRLICLSCARSLPGIEHLLESPG